MMIPVISLIGRTDARTYFGVRRIAPTCMIAKIPPAVLAAVGVMSGWLSVALSVRAAIVAATLESRSIERHVTSFLQGSLPCVRRHRTAAIEPGSR